jgi:sugar/nucleoside kinase (ribokinase family)
MKTDALILNTAAVDIRRPDFEFVLKVAAEGGLALCATEDMPACSQAQIREWLEQGCGTAGGCGNVAPIMSRAGLSVAIGANLGAGAYGGLDAQGRFFHDSMTAYGVDLSDVYVHPHLPTGTAFAHDAAQADRKGLAVFLNANNDFDLARFLRAVRRRRPTVVYYMYSGLSERADANGGRDLAAFMRACREQGAVTLADSHTLTGNPKQLIAEGCSVAKYRLLDPLLPEVDVFFTSSDEARLIGNTLLDRPVWQNDPARDNGAFLRAIAARYWRGDRVRLFGVTVRDGAYVVYGGPDGKVSDVALVRSPFVASGGLNLIGAGDAFRAGLMSYVARHVEAFRAGAMDVHEAVSTGNLFAATYVTAPLDDRFAGMRRLEDVLARLRGQAKEGRGLRD